MRGHEARKLFAELAQSNGSKSDSWNDLDPIWRDSVTGGTIFIGNDTAARGPPGRFEQFGITHIVNATDDLPNYCEGAADLEYFTFNIARHGTWFRSGEAGSLIEFLTPLFRFVDAAVSGGGSVLVHCLAGAHRAGTTGCLLLMYKEGLSADDATQLARHLRPVINPIGNRCRIC